MYTNRFASISNALMIVVFALIASSCSMRSETTKLEIVLPATLPNPVMTNAYWKSGSVPISGMSMSPSDVSAMSVAVKFVTVSVTGVGMGEVSQQWFREAGAVNPVVTVDGVPRGAGRLVQVIAAGDDGSGMVFYYGEGRFDAEKDVVDVTVVMTALSNAAQGEADIEGRYLAAGGVGPTGHLKVMYKPSSNNPPMTIFKTEMIAGWFSTMAPAFGEFTYVLEETGAVLFDRVNASNAGYVAKFQNGNPARNALIQIPLATRPRWQTADPSDREVMIPRRLIAGFFGDTSATSSKLLCYSSLPSDPLQEVWAGTSSTQIKWNGASIPPGASAGIPNAGVAVASGTSTCSGDSYIDNLTFNHQGIRNRDKLLSFQGPFGLADVSNKRYALTSFAAGVMTVNWSYLPDVTNVISGVTVYKRNNHNAHDDQDIRAMMNGYNCGAITTMTNMGDVPVTHAQPEQFAVNGVTQAEYDNSNVQVLLCPYTDSAKGRQYWSSGMTVDLMGAGFGGGGMDMTPAKLASYDVFSNPTSAASQAQTYADSCYPISIKPLTSSDTQAMPGMSGLALNISTGDGSSVLYNSDDCSASSFNIEAPTIYSGEYRVWAKPTGAGTLAVNITSGTLTPTTFFMNIAAAQPANVLGLHGPANLTQNLCVPVSLGLTKSGIPSALGNTLAVDFDFANGWLFFNNPDCSSGYVPSFSFNVYQSTRALSMVYTGTLTGARTVGFTTSDPNFSGGTVAASTVTVQAAPVPAKLIFYDLPTTVEAGQCYEFGVRLASAAGQETAHLDSFMQTPGSMPVTFLTGEGQFFSSTCGGGGSGASSPKYIYPYRTWSDKVKFMATQTGAVTIAGSISSTLAGGVSINPVATTTITATPGLPTKVVAVMPGEFFSSGMLPSGVPSGQNVGVGFTINLFAVNEGWKVADGTGGMSNFTGSISFTDPDGDITYSTNMLTFSGGSATVTVSQGVLSNFRPDMTNNAAGGLQIMQATGSMVPISP